MTKTKERKINKKWGAWEIIFNKKRYIFCGRKPEIKKVKLTNGGRITFIHYDEASNLFQI